MSHPIRVLLVEDDQEDATLVQDILRDLPQEYLVDVAPGAASALSLFHTPSKYDVVLLDYKLPDMSGLDLYREMLKLRPLTPFILITGAKDRWLQAEAQEARIPFLEKGLLRPDLLEQMITVCLMKVPQTEEATSEATSFKDMVRLATNVAKVDGIASTLSDVVASLARIEMALQDVKVESRDQSVFGKIKSLLDWVVANPKGALGLAVGCMVLLLLTVVLIRLLDVQQIAALKGLLK